MNRAVKNVPVSYFDRHVPVPYNIIAEDTIKLRDFIDREVI